MASINTRLEKTLLRLAALFDGAAWLLIAPAALALWAIDPPMLKTLGTWSVYFLVASGAMVVISRVIFPHIDLTEMVQEARKGNRAAGAVVLALLLFDAFLILAFVLWARPVGA